MHIGSLYAHSTKEHPIIHNPNFILFEEDF